MTPKWSDEEGDAPGAGGIRSTDGSGEITMVGRRRFLLLGIGGSAAALVGGTALPAAAAASTTVPVWRLSADWGYRVPPTNRTRCRCKACRGHAANKIFESKAAALANRSHPCCVCQPYSIDLLASDSAALFASTSAGSIDLRNRETRRRFEAAVVRSLQTAPPDPPTRAMGTPPVAPARLAADAPSSPTAAATTASPSTTLPATGADHELILAAGGVLVVAGVAAVVAAATTA
ncbi:MAG: hypothetical protein ACXVLX_10510 [Ilumatobacteraceae bacterium]